MFGAQIATRSPGCDPGRDQRRAPRRRPRRASCANVSRARSSTSASRVGELRRGAFDERSGSCREAARSRSVQYSAGDAADTKGSARSMAETRTHHRRGRRPSARAHRRSRAAPDAAVLHAADARHVSQRRDRVRRRQPAVVRSRLRREDALGGRRSRRRRSSAATRSSARTRSPRSRPSTAT